MPDFTQLLKRPAGEAKPPQPLDAGDYPGIIKSFEVGDNNKNKTPYVRFFVALTGWPEGQEAQTSEDGTPVDLSGKQLRRDFYLTDESFYILDEFLASLGIELHGRTYEETVPEAVGQAVLVEVQQYMNQSTGRFGNQVGSLRAMA